MKQLTKDFSYKTIFTLLTLALMQTALWAQESGGTSESSGSSSSTVKTTTTQTTSEWYTSPWVWVLGAAVFILLLIALLRGNSSGATASRTDRVTVTKTTDTDIV
ncbi:MAG: hypothetical protein JWQ96_665 [Segetibacter sp.]|nr:hypothetical protein [Segetibacter sp.]